MGMTRCLFVLATVATTSAAPQPAQAPYLADRGIGVASSMFGTYIRKHDLIVYPYWEYYRDNNREYKPAELGYTLDQDFRGRYRESEYLFFLAYGLTDNFAVQTEIAGASASLDKAATDPSSQPSRVENSGLTSFETQARWRWKGESERRPEVWGYLDVVYPINKDAKIIGSDGFDVEWGTALTRGFSWGTLTARASLFYESASSTHFGLGEYGIEWLKHVNPKLRVFGAVNGHADEVTAITELQLHFSPKVFLRLNQEIGLTSRANDWEPQIGLLLTLPLR